MLRHTPKRLDNRSKSSLELARHRRHHSVVLNLKDYFIHLKKTTLNKDEIRISKQKNADYLKNQHQTCIKKLAYGFFNNNNDGARKSHSIYLLSFSIIFLIKCINFL